MVNLLHSLFGPEHREVRFHRMQSLASLAFLLPHDVPGPVNIFTLALYLRVHPHLLPAVFLSTSRVADGIIGLSCIAIAAMLVSFLISSGKSIPFRWQLVSISAGTALAGIACLFTAADAPGIHPRLVACAPLLLAAFALLCACLVPYVIPQLISRSRELDSASRAAEKNEARFLAAAQSTYDALFLLDALRSPDGIIEDFLFTYLNANAEKIIAKPSSEVLGARLTRILPIGPSSKLFEQFRQVVLTGKPLIHEFPLYPNDPYGPWMRHHVARLEDGLAITASDITERKRSDPNWRKDAHLDTLTGLPNRRLLEDRIGQAIARADRYHTTVAVFIVNIDSFQRINDDHGRSFGDEVIRTTGSRLRHAIRASDTVIRLGGDEFIVIMPDMQLEIDVRRAAATLVHILREPITVSGQTVENILQPGRQRLSGQWQERQGVAYRRRYRHVQGQVAGQKSVCPLCRPPLQLRRRHQL